MKCELFLNLMVELVQPLFTCSKLTKEVPEQYVKYVHC